MFRTNDTHPTAVKADRLSAGDPNQLDVSELDRANALLAEVREERDHWFDQVGDLKEEVVRLQEELVKRYEDLQKKGNENACWQRVFEANDSALRLLENSEERVVRANDQIVELEANLGDLELQLDYVLHHGERD